MSFNRTLVTRGLLVLGALIISVELATAQLPLELAVVVELNKLRADPAAYAQRLELRKTWYRGKDIARPDNFVVVKTSEGKVALNEAISVLRNTPKLPAVKLVAGMSSAAADQARDLSETGTASHEGSDGSSPDERIERYGAWEESCAETIAFAEFASAEDVISLLVIDDGVPDRGHRKALLNPIHHVVGVAVTKHPAYGQVCVITLAGGFVPKAK